MLSILAKGVSALLAIAGLALFGVALVELLEALQIQFPAYTEFFKFLTWAGAAYILKLLIDGVFHSVAGQEGGQSEEPNKSGCCGKHH